MGTLKKGVEDSKALTDFSPLELSLINAKPTVDNISEVVLFDHRGIPFRMDSNGMIAEYLQDNGLPTDSVNTAAIQDKAVTSDKLADNINIRGNFTVDGKVINASNEVYVNSLSDLPTPVDKGGIWGEAIYCEDGIRYIQNVPYLATPYTIIAPENYGGGRYSGAVGLKTKLVKTGSGPLFAHPDEKFGFFEIDSIIVSAPDTDGMLWDFKSDNPSKGSYFSANAVYGYDIYRVGYVRDNCSLDVHFSGPVNASHGLTLQNTDSVFIGSSSWWTGWKNIVGSVKLTVEGTYGDIIMVGFVFQNESNEAAFDIKSTSTGQGIVIDGSVVRGTGAVFAPGSKTHADPEIIVGDVPGMTSSTTSAQVDLGTNATETELPAISAKVLIDSNQWIASELERMTVDSNGVATYNGLETKREAITFSLTLNPSSGVNQELSIRICKFLLAEYTVTFTNGTNTINETATALSNGDTISFYDNDGTLPAELREDVIYYVVNKATDSFQVSYTSGGAAVVFTDDGSGTIEYKVAILNGIPASAKVTSTETKSLTRFGLVELSTGDKIGLIGWNDSTSNNIEATSGGYISQ